MLASRIHLSLLALRSSSLVISSVPIAIMPVPIVGTNISTATAVIVSISILVSTTVVVPAAIVVTAWTSILPCTIATVVAVLSIGMLTVAIVPLSTISVRLTFSAPRIVLTMIEASKALLFEEVGRTSRSVRVFRFEQAVGLLSPLVHLVDLEGTPSTYRHDVRRYILIR